MIEMFQLKGSIKEPSLDIPLNWRDMRSAFGYKLLTNRHCLIWTPRSGIGLRRVV